MVERKEVPKLDTTPPKIDKVDLTGVGKPIKPYVFPPLEKEVLAANRREEFARLGEEVRLREEREKIDFTKKYSLQTNERSKEIADQKAADRLREELKAKWRMQEGEQAKREAEAAIAGRQTREAKKLRKTQKDKNITKFPESYFINPTKEPATVLRDEIRRSNQERARVEGLEAKRRAQDKLRKK